MEKMNYTEPFRILMTADTVGGTWTYALQLARALEIHRAHVYLATMGAPLTTEQRMEIAGLPNVTLFESGFKLEWMHNAWESVTAAGEWLLELAYEIRPDVIHINGYTHGNLPWPAPVVVVAHSCVYSWWEATKTEPVPSRWAQYRNNVKAGLQTANAVITPSATMLADLNAKYGRFTNQQVIYNGCYPGEYQVAIKQPFILGMGNPDDEAKNLYSLCQAASGFDWPVRIVGDKGMPYSLGISEKGNVHWLGRLSRQALKQQLSQAAIFALPARYEPFGLSALEAALSGCVLVLGDIPSLREIWQDTAVYVAPDQPKALQEAIEHLISNNLYRMRMATQSRQRALQFTASRMAAQYMHMYLALPRKENRPQLYVAQRA
jgi:glycogen synthase